jgi:hypothetical protein
MFHSFYSQLSIVALVLCCGFAIWKGGLAERAGALLIATTWIVTLVASAATQSYMPATAFLTSDAIMAIGLLFLAVRYSSWWMGVAMLVQAAVLSFHAAYFGADQTEISKKVLHFYVMGKNLASIGLLVIILAATVASIIKRSRLRSRETARQRLDLTPAPTAG